MSKISEYLQLIKTAIYGREVRDAIHDSIEQCYTDVTNAKTLADTATSNANAAASNANSKATLANNAAAAANAATSSANTAASNANSKATLANNAASNADTATASANAAASNANSVASQVQTKLDNGEFIGPTGPQGNTGSTPVITATASTGLPGTDVTVKQSGTAENVILEFTIPRGDTGKVENLDETIASELNARDLTPMTEEAIDAAISSAEEV